MADEEIQFRFLLGIFILAVVMKWLNDSNSVFGLIWRLFWEKISGGRLLSSKVRQQNKEWDEEARLKRLEHSSHKPLTPLQVKNNRAKEDVDNMKPGWAGRMKGGK